MTPSLEKPPDGLTGDIRSRIESLVNAGITKVRLAPGGYSSACRWIMTADSGVTFFAKIGMTPASIENLRQEIAVYDRVHLDCMPRALGWQDDVAHPILLLEDLSACQWPPPWDKRKIDRTLTTVAGMHRIRADIDDFTQRHGNRRLDWWQLIGEDTTAFLQLAVVTADWLNASLPELIERSAACNVSGQFLCHFDLRSDNLCFSERGAIVIDWSHACLGNPMLDLGLFLPSLTEEGGPLPEQILGYQPSIAAWVSGFYAFHASKPFIPTAPHVRTMQRRYLTSSIAWATKALGL